MDNKVVKKVFIYTYMISQWVSFNESNEYRQTIIDKFNYISDEFIDFEDDGIVLYYHMSTDRYDRSMGYAYNPSNGGFDKFLNNQIPVIEESLKKKRYKQIFITVSMKLERTTPNIIGKEGIDMLSSIIKVCNKLISNGYDVQMGLNGMSVDYKPIELIVSFPL